MATVTPLVRSDEAPPPDQQSESLKELATALAKAQAEIENPLKTAENTHFHSRYADLAEIIGRVRPVLSKHGLAVMQFPGYDDGVATVETILAHTSGEWIRRTAAAPVVKRDPQGVGSATTYLRRYSLAALCGIAQEDDDANGAGRAQPSTNGNGSRSRQGARPSAPTCPVCDGPMWDNREGKKNPKAPDYKCKKKECDGVYWPGEWPPPEDTSAEDQAAEMDRLAAGAQTLVNDLKGMDAERGDAAQKALDDLIKKEGVTAAEIRKFGGKVKYRIEQLEAEAKALADADEDDDDMPF